MTRVLATLVLVFAQALPWAGGPLFVCVEGDGSVCLDGGPRNCDCCATDAASTSCHDRHDGEMSTHLCSTPHDVEASGTPCDCEHQLWEAAPTTPAGRASTHHADLTVSAAFSLPAVGTPLVAMPQAIAAPLRGPSAAAAERMLACVVLRC